MHEFRFKNLSTGTKPCTVFLLVCYGTSMVPGQMVCTQIDILKKLKNH